MQKVDQRTRQILLKLIEKPIISSKNLSTHLKLTKVQIDYVITKVNELLAEETLPPVWFDGNYFHLSDDSRLFLVEFFSNDQIYRQYEMDIDERKKIHLPHAFLSY